MKLNCLCCGDVFQYSQSRGRRRKFCSLKCKDRYWGERKPRYRKSRKPQLCKTCNVEFTPLRKSYGFCSDTCSAEKQQERYIEVIKRRKPKNEKTALDIPRVCVWCEDEFIAYHSQQKLCSTECRKHYKNRGPSNAAQNAKRRGVRANASNIDPLKIFWRDKWKCRCCGCNTPKKLRGTYEDNAPEIDHIVPISKGGEHKPENVQLLCRKCNIQKSDRIEGQFLLFG